MNFFNLWAFRDPFSELFAMGPGLGDSHCSPGLALCLMGPWKFCLESLDLLPTAPLPPMQKQDVQHQFLQHRRHTHTHTKWIARTEFTLRGNISLVQEGPLGNPPKVPEVRNQMGRRAPHGLLDASAGVSSRVLWGSAGWGSMQFSEGSDPTPVTWKNDDFLHNV